MEMRSSNKGDECGPLSGNQYFDLIISKSHINPLYVMHFPSEMNKALPPMVVPTVVLTHKDRKWNVQYRMMGGRGKLDGASWKEFVDDNRLKEGDGLVFEVVECRVDKLEFKVHILRDETPPEIAPRLSGTGGGGGDSQESVITIK